MPSDTPKNAVVLLSGGMDSAVTLAAARAEGFTCAALTIDYGQRHRVELAAAQRVARSIGVPRHAVVRIDLRALGGSALTDDLPVPKNMEASGPRTSGAPSNRPPPIPVTYVPGRNIVFLGLAVGWAETLGARDVFLGVNQVDYSGYPDCREGFVRAFEHAAALGTRAGAQAGAPVRIRTPLVNLTKARIIRLGADLGVDFSLTHSCYDPDDDGAACGRCDACVLRRRGFAEAGVPDPARYAPMDRAGVR